MANQKTKIQFNDSGKCKKRIHLRIFKKEKWKLFTFNNYYMTIFFIELIFLIIINNVKGQTRDPRFYSREGDRNFKWPNPGDPDYRYVIK